MQNSDINQLPQNDRTNDRLLETIVSYVMENFAEEISLEDMSSTVGISRFSLCRAFQRQFKVTPMRWLWTFRAILAFEFIALEPRWSLTDIAFSCGFTSSAHFSRLFKSVFKCSPSQHRSQALQALRQSEGIPTLPRTFDAAFNADTGTTRRVAQSAMELSRTRPPLSPMFR